MSYGCKEPSVSLSISLLESTALPSTSANQKSTNTNTLIHISNTQQYYTHTTSIQTLPPHYKPYITQLQTPYNSNPHPIQSNPTTTSSTQPEKRREQSHTITHSTQDTHIP
ncbi:hypothetical protein M758_7G111500 [Ceratodon purpureus]|nr:hypothetical protein M758_7G111500 [Ceratodon purpureus]